MEKLKIALLQKKDADKIKPLINAFDFRDYRYYVQFKKEALDEYILKNICGLLPCGANGWVIGAWRKNRIAGLITLQRLEWAKEIFGMDMAQIGYLILPAGCENKKNMAKALLRRVFRVCRKDGIFHLSCRIETGDYAAVNTLIEEGFKIVETSVTYLFNKRKYRIPFLKDMAKVRPFEKRDLESLVEMTKGAFLLSRFYTDSNISSRCAERFYVSWLKKCCAGLLADKVLVAERKGIAVGYLAYRLNKEFEKFTGYKIAGQGISAVSEKGTGVYPALVKAAAQDVVSYYDFGEFDTQINNYAAIKVWQRFGFEFVRSKYTLHNWLGG